MRIRMAIAATWVFCLSAAATQAQVRIGGALGQHVQTDGKSDSPYLGPGFGGTSLAGIGMIDVAVGSRVTVGAEVSLAGGISGIQSQRASGGNNTLVSVHRDTVFSGVVKFGTPLDQRVRAAAIVGGGTAQRRTDRDGTFLSFSSAPQSTFHEQLSDMVPALTGGIDVAVGLTSHVALLGIGRLYLLKDDDKESSGVLRRGVSSRIVRYGGGVQIRF